MTKLNQIIAVEKGVKSRTSALINALYHTIQKTEVFHGLSKEYQPLNEDDKERLPAENVKVQLTYKEVLDQVEKVYGELLRTVARKDWTNQEARANIVVEGKVLLADVPVTTLLFMEKWLTDYQTLVARLPILDETQSWSEDTNTGLNKTPVVQTHRTKKVPKPITLAPATDKHPAQVQLLQEDVLAGYWNTIKYSGAIPKTKKVDILDRIDVLSKAIKVAREEANTQEEIQSPNIGELIFGYLNK